MRNTISIGGMTNYYNSYINTKTSKKVSDVPDSEKFSSKGISEEDLVERSKTSMASFEVARIRDAGITSPKDMTLDEYKSYISEKISSYSIHPSIMGDNISISITDAGYKAMQNDPEYEKWVMDGVKGMLTNEYPNRNRALTGTICCVASFGASKEECRCLSWSEGYQNGNGKNIWEKESMDSVWKSRDSKKKLRAQQEKKIRDKHQHEKKLTEMTLERKREYQRITNMHFNNVNDIMNHTDINSTSHSLASASSTYEANLLYLDESTDMLR